MDQLVEPDILEEVLSSIPYIMAKEREGEKNFSTFHIKKKNLGNFGHKQKAQSLLWACCFFEKVLLRFISPSLELTWAGSKASAQNAWEAQLLAIKVISWVPGHFLENSSLLRNNSPALSPATQGRSLASQKTPEHRSSSFSRNSLICSTHASKDNFR